MNECRYCGRPAPSGEFCSKKCHDAFYGERGLRVLRQVAKKIGRRTSWMRLEDLEELGLLAVVQSLERYDPARGPFEPYVARMVRWAILEELRLDARRARILESPEACEAMRELSTFAGALPVDDAHEHRETLGVVLGALSDLSPRDAEIARLVWFQDLQACDASKQVGRSKTWASRSLDRTREHVIGRLRAA